MWLVILLLISIVNAEYIRDGKSYSSRRQFLLDSIAHKNDSIPVVKTKSINSNSLPITDSLMIKGLNVKQADIRDLIQGIAMQFNLNIVLDKQVEGDVTVNFNNISVKEALTLLIEENGLEYKLGSGNTIKILMKKKPIVKELVPEKHLYISYKDSMLFVDVENQELSEVIRTIIEKTDQNIVVENNISFKVSGFIKKLPLKQSLRLFAKTNGLLFKERNGIFTLYKNTWGESGSAGTNVWVKLLGDSLTVELTNAPIASVVAQISLQSGINTVVYGELKGKVTAKLTNRTISEVLNYLFRDNEYSFWTHNDIYFIGPKSMRSFSDQKLIVLEHLKADEVLEILPGDLKKDADLQVIKGQNALMVMGEYDKILGIESYIKEIDLPVPMILIEAMVIDIDLDKVRDYGLKLFIGKTPVPQAPEAIYPNVNQTINSDQANGFFDGMPGLKDVVNLPSDFFAQLKALEGEKVLKVRSRPQIATLNGQTAQLTVGQTQYFLLSQETDYNQSSQALTSRRTERFEKIEANVNLTVTPWVTGKGEITAEIIPDFSEPEGSFNSELPPTLNRRLLKSQVKLRDGETIILGGLVKEGRQEVHEQVPFLGSIPYLGWLFKNVSYVDTRSQLMIFVTPRIYYGSESNVDPEKFLKELQDQ